MLTSNFITCKLVLKSPLGMTNKLIVLYCIVSLFVSLSKQNSFGSIHRISSNSLLGHKTEPPNLFCVIEISSAGSSLPSSSSILNQTNKTLYNSNLSLGYVRTLSYYFNASATHSERSTEQKHPFVIVPKLFWGPYWNFYCHCQCNPHKVASYVIYSPRATPLVNK